MNEPIRILSEIEPSDLSAAEGLLPPAYDESRRLAAVRMAHERVDHTLDATALVHEAFVNDDGTNMTVAIPSDAATGPLAVIGDR